MVYFFAILNVTVPYQYEVLFKTLFHKCFTKMIYIPSGYIRAILSKSIKGPKISALAF